MRYQCHPDGYGCVLSPKDTDGDGAIDPICKGQVEDETIFDCADNDKRREPKERESFDGLDNDCDSIIDEGVIAREYDDERFEADELFENEVKAHRVFYASASPGEADIGFATADDDVYQAGLAVLSEKADKSERSVSIREGGNDQSGYMIYNFSELATARASADRFDLIAAFINTDGCSQGQLRVGFIKEGYEPKIKMPQESNCHQGIEIDADTSCSNSGGNPGASRVAIASQHFPNQQTQGLIAWIGDTVERDNCGDMRNVPVQLLGFWLTDEDIIQVSDNGKPKIVGETRGGGRPAIDVWSDGVRGYFVGFSDENGSAVVTFVPTLPELNSRVDPAAISIGPLFEIEEGERADQIALAHTPIRDVCPDQEPGIELGVSWQYGCGGVQGGLRFAVLGFAANTRTFCLQHPIIEITTGDASDPRLVPTVVYLKKGFFEPGFERDGLTVTDINSGGWLVAWVGLHNGTSAILARRVAELDGELVDADEVIVLNREISAGEVRYPFLYNSQTEGRVRYIYHERLDTERFVGGSLLLY
ncbi:MAG: hypothetical protein JXA30_21105 [Deltaproteobacteria bacterium]|nr:hypothetical protein [Deltaproteobacteria bacterium]